MLFGSTFWRRSWIIQELVLAQEAFPIYGSDLISLDWTLLLAQELMSFYVQMGHDDWPVPNLVVDMASVMPIYDVLVDFIASHSEPNHDLLQLLQLFAFSSVTDPRDTIYSLLGIARRFPQTHLPIDCSISCSRYDDNTAVYIIRGRPSLDILQLSGSGQQDGPSWVPDWTARDHGVSRAFSNDIGAGFRASDNNVQVYTSALVSADRPHPTVDATIVAEVSQIIQAPQGVQIKRSLEAVFWLPLPFFRYRVPSSIVPGHPALLVSHLGHGFRGFVFAIPCSILHYQRTPSFWRDTGRTLNSFNSVSI